MATAIPWVRSNVRKSSLAHARANAAWPFGCMATAHGCDTMTTFAVWSRSSIAPKSSLRPAMTPFGSFGSVWTSCPFPEKSMTLMAGKSVSVNWNGWVGARSSCGTHIVLPSTVHATLSRAKGFPCGTVGGVATGWSARRTFPSTARAGRAASETVVTSWSMRCVT